MTDKQPEALELADSLEKMYLLAPAKELRRQHQEILDLKKSLHTCTKLTSNMKQCFVKEYSNKRDVQEYLENILDSINIFLDTCYIKQGETPEDADQGFHDSWAEKSLRSEVLATRKLLDGLK